MLIDSNIIIYAAQPQHTELRRFVAQHAPAVSAVSVVEVLGFHRLTAPDRQHFEEFFAAATVYPLSNVVLEQAIKLRQIRKMTLADALIAGTALAYDRTLVTRNTKDFDWVAGLNLLNPFAT